MAFQFPHQRRHRVDGRYEVLRDGSPTLQRLLLPAERRDDLCFVVIGGVPISIDDLDAALRLEDPSGVLDAQEIQAIVWPESDDGDREADDLARYIQSDESELKPKLEAARGKKQKRILALADAYLKSIHGAIPRKEALLMAFSKGKLHFSDLSSYLASVASLDEAGATAVARTRGEVEGALAPQSRAIHAESSRALGEVLSDSEFEWFCKMLSIPPEQLRGLAMVVMERALMEHPFEPEDARQVFTYDQSRSGVSVPYYLEQTTFMATGISLPFALAAGALLGGVSGPFFAPIMAYTYVAFFGSLAMAVSAKAGFAPLSSLARWRAVRGKERALTGEYQAAYQALRTGLEEMKKTPFGHMKVLYLQLWLQSKVGVSPVDEAKLLVLLERSRGVEREQRAFAAFYEFKGKAYFESAAFEAILDEFELWPKE